MFFVGTQGFGQAHLELELGPSVRVSLVKFRTPGALQKLNYVWWSLRVLAFAIVLRPVSIYASDVMATPAALIAAMLLRIPTVYHEHDYAAGQRTIFDALLQNTRSALLRRAVCSVAPNEQRMMQLVKDGAREDRATVVRNYPSVGEVGPERSVCSNPVLWLHYHGSLVPARLPLSLIEALALLPSQVKLRIMGFEPYGRDYRNELLRRVEELNLGNRVDVRKSVARHRELLEIANQGDVGLCLLGDLDEFNHRSMVGASQKPYEYLACGMAVLVERTPEWCQAFVDPGYGLACDSGKPESIASAIGQFVDDRSRTREMGELGRRRIMVEWNYENEFGPVAASFGTVRR